MTMEVSPSSDWCQRWNGGTHTWRHRSDGGFDPAAYTVEAVDERTAKTFVLAHHYSGTYPAARLRFGLFEHDVLVGVAVLSIPTSVKVLTNMFDVEPYTEALELGRLVLNDACPANSESWFLARVFEEAAARGLRGVVSFADPVPRRTPSGLLFPGHVGTIYQASNARYLGRGTARTLTLLPDGVVLSARAMQKVRAGERGHEHVEQRLVALGARAPGTGHRARWLADALDDIGATRLRHGGNHRYAFALGDRSARRRLRIAGDERPYPKHPDQEAA